MDLPDLSVFDQFEGVAYAIDDQFTIRWVNTAWYDFAASNGLFPTDDWGVGLDVLKVTPTVLRPFYFDFFWECYSSTSLVPRSHDYNCPSATRYRLARMRIVPLHASGLLLILNSQIAEEAHRGLQKPVPHEIYTADKRRLVQCADCRHFRRPGTDDCWDWISDWIWRPPAVVDYVLCDNCQPAYKRTASTPAGALGQQRRWRPRS